MWYLLWLKFSISFLEGVGQMLGAICVACVFIIAVKLMMLAGVV